MKRHTIVLEAGQVGAVFALALAPAAGISNTSWVTRRDGCVQVFGYAPDDDKAARARWVRECKKASLSVRPAPWEKKEAKAS